MIPTLSVPNIQVPPPVEVSVITGHSHQPALGRLPTSVVPAPLTSPKVAEDGRNGQHHARHGQNARPAATAMPSFGLFMGGTGQLAFETPYSTTFMAQLFGQFGALDAEAFGGGVLDFEQLAQFSMIKYKPSMASRPADEMPERAREARQAAQARQAATEAAILPEEQEMNLFAPETPSMPVLPVQAEAPREQPRENTIFVSGMDAYGATHQRNRWALEALPVAAADQEISLVL